MSPHNGAPPPALSQDPGGSQGADHGLPKEKEIRFLYLLQIDCFAVFLFNCSIKWLQARAPGQLMLAAMLC